MQWLIVTAAASYLFGSFRLSLLLAGLVCEILYLLLRALAMGRLPLVGPHDTLLFFSASIVLLSLPFLRSPALTGERNFTWLVGVSACCFLLPGLLFPAYVMPMPPILRTLWFELHVALAFFAYSLFVLGALLGGRFLLGGQRASLDLQYRAILVGFTFFSLSMITGGIWGYYAWGTYWLWTAKELWTSILWIYYSLWLHLRLKGEGMERIVAWGGIAGLLITLFTYLGVSLLMKSSHSF